MNPKSEKFVDELIYMHESAQKSIGIYKEKQWKLAFFASLLTGWVEWPDEKKSSIIHSDLCDFHTAIILGLVYLVSLFLWYYHKINIERGVLDDLHPHFSEELQKIRKPRNKIMGECDIGDLLITIGFIFYLFILKWILFQL